MHTKDTDNESNKNAILMIKEKELKKLKKRK